MPDAWDSVDVGGSGPKDAWDATPVPGVKELDSWAEANQGDGIQYTDRPPKDEGFFARQERIRKKKLEEFKAGGTKGFLKKLLDSPVDPFSAAGRAYRDAKEMFTDEPASDLIPNAGAPSIIKGIVMAPQGLAQRGLNAVAPDSAAAGYSNRFSARVNDWYNKQGFTQSDYGEGMGQNLLSAKIPQWGGSLPRIITGGAATGALQNVARPVSGDGWDTPTSAEVNTSTGEDLFTGALAGGGVPLLAEGVGRIGRAVSPYLRNFKQFLAEKRGSLGGVDPHEALISDMLEKKGVSSMEGSRRYDELAATRGAQEADANPLVMQLDDAVAELRRRAPEDTGLINHLESMANKYRAKQVPSGVLDSRGNPVMKAAPPEAPPTIENLINTYRNAGNMAGQAVDTAGQNIQRTTTGEEVKRLSEVKELIRKIIGKKDPTALDQFDANRKFWREGDSNFTAPAEFTDKTRGGRLLNALKSSDKPDVAVTGLMKNKSEVLADRVGNMTTPKGRTAIQVKVLEDANKAAGSMEPDAWVASLTDKNGNLHPMVKLAFQGDDRKALEGFIKLKKYSSGLAKATNIGGAIGIGAMGGGALGGGGGALGGAAGGAGLASTALWARRGSWLNTWSAPVWEKMMNNSATRGALKAMAKLPPASPEFAKAVAVVNAAMEEDE